MRYIIYLVLFTLCVAVPSKLSAASEKAPTWLFGTWKGIADEDGTPPDILSFDASGKYISYGIGCATHDVMDYHLHNGNVYVTIEIPGKGPIAIVFHPTADKSRLTFTSPRSRNNATYAKLRTNPCGKKL